MIKLCHLATFCGLILLIVGCGKAVKDSDAQAPGKSVQSRVEVDGWKLEPVSPSDPMTRTLTKDGNELMIIYSDNPSKEALDTFNEIIPAIKSRGAETINLADMSGYLEVTQLKPNDSTLPTLMVTATLKGPSEILQIGFKGEGDRDITRQFVSEAVMKFHSKWKRLYHDNLDNSGEE